MEEIEEMEEFSPYVSKKQYDSLFRLYVKAKNHDVMLQSKLENCIKEAQDVDMSTLLDMSDFETLKEKKAYMMGVFSALEHFVAKLEDIEEEECN